MSSPNFPSRSNVPFRSSSVELETARRYSLAYDLIGSTDRLINHPSRQMRVIEYQKGDIVSDFLREKLMSRNLILGSIITDEGANEQAFIVPRSARPLAYDSTSNVEGNYSYNDRKLFLDLGAILASAVTVDPIPHVIRGEIGRALAIVDFIKVRERQLFFVPGIERILEPIDPSILPFEYYLRALQEEFGPRFQNSVQEMRRGFAMGLADGLQS